MRLRSMVILLAVIPFTLSTCAVIFIVRQNNTQLADLQISSVQSALIQARKDELRHFVKIARSAILNESNKSMGAQEQKKAALKLLRSMDFGEDNYLYVYDIDGKNLMHPRLQHLEGHNQWDLRDHSGVPIIQNLISAALTGGGYVEYMWNRPSTGREESKMGYVELIPEWGWIIGTGLYLDNLYETKALIAESSSNAITKTSDQILIVTFIGLFFVAGGGLALNLYEQRAANERLRAMARRVVLSQEIERARVARELHDGVTQMLASVKFIFESALIQIERKTNGAEIALREGLNQMRGVMKEVRRISHGLRPMLLNDLGLTSAVEQIAREFSERTKISVATDIGHFPQLSNQVATEVFRVVQEALGNVEKHSLASHVWIKMHLTDGGLLLQLRDDGIGFDIEAKLHQRQAGLGLTNMRERIEMLGGRFTITSRSGETLIEAYLTARVLTP